MSQKFDVIIVGGGMGGMALALALARRGRSVAVVERQARPRPFARGELLQPNGLRILNQLGLLEALKKLPSYLAYEYHFHRIEGGRLCTVDYRVLPPPWNYTLILTPYYLLNLLFQKLEQTELVHLFTETDFSELLRQNGRVVGIRAVRMARSIELFSPVVVGSDGAHSQVREAMGIQSEVYNYPEAYLTMIIPRPKGFHRDARYYLGQGEILGLFPVSAEKLYLFYMIRTAELERIRKGPLDSMLNAIGRIDRALREPLETVASWNEVGVMPCVRVRAKRWTADGAALIGDAAHAMNPHVAQGRNQALEDAVTLAEVLDHAFQKGNFSEEGLRPYETQRRRRVENLQRQADEMALFWNTGLIPLTWLRNRVFKRLDRNDRLRYKMLALIAGESSERFTWMDRVKAAGILPV
jgi:2-polyprenyl-6-methoxyphenol hydroxylase-like FAD-dependent oxidoreductase